MHPVRRALVVLALGWCAACSSGSERPAATPAQAPSILPGDALPDATDAVLTVSTPGDDATVVDLDVATIDAMGTSTVTLFEPWLERDVTFEGVWAADLLAVTGAGDGSTVQLHAIDDYEVDFAIDDLAAGDALLATHADGELIDIADGGPVRLVFVDPDGPGTNLDLWIWNLDAITVD